jgi:hypothetical protein
VITSCITLSGGTVKFYAPIRFAGTIRTYSKKAIPQLMRIAT